jgi:hypothetical protein
MTVPDWRERLVCWRCGRQRVGYGDERNRAGSQKRRAGSTGVVAASILLKSGRAQTEQSVSCKGLLPAQEFFLRQLIAAAGLLSGQYAICHGGHDRGLAADRPPFDIDRRQRPLQYFSIVEQSSCHARKCSNRRQKSRYLSRLDRD